MVINQIIKKGSDVINPIFKEYIQFLEHNGCEKKLEEGYYWLDRQIIKAFDMNGNIHKILRVYTDDDLNITFKHYKTKEFKIEKWQDTIKRYIPELQQLESDSLEVIRESRKEYESHTPFTLTSGGKDSSLTDYLVGLVDKSIRRKFSNTSLDNADTYLHIKSLDCDIINPDEGFYQWRKRLEFIPTRFRRACCDVFKEGAMIQKLDKDEKYLFFMGMRNDESSNRSEYGDKWKNHKWGEREWQGILPIRKWTELQVWLYILWKGIDINTKYRKGYSRVGCAIACPYYTKSTWILDRYWYSKMYNKWQEILKEDFINNYKWTRMNCTLEEYKTSWNGGLKREEPNEEVIKEFAEYKGINLEVAEKYFNHECSYEGCNKKVNKKDDVAMNMKFNGRNIDKFYCKKHLMEILDVNKEQWDSYIESFNSQGCDLF